MAPSAELRIVEGEEQAFATPLPDQAPPFASASSAVPLLWPGLFSYDEARPRRVGSADIFAATTSLSTALSRAQALAEALPRHLRALVGAARVLAQQLAKQAGSHVVLFPVALMSEMDPRAGRAYLKQLFNLCDLWDRVRAGAAWDEVTVQLQQISPDIDRALGQPDERRVRYYLVGSLAELSELEAFALEEGQAEGDLEPEALAVGEHGLLVGRFGGRWKLMASGSDEDLLGVWGEGDTAFAVGRRGTVLQLKKGRWAPVEVPSTHTLNAVWGLSRSSVCVVGDRGTVLAYNGQRWQLWPVPTHAALHAVWGDKLDNLYLAGQDTAVLRYDGYAWTRAPLPVEGFVSQLNGRDGVPVGSGGSRRGGEVFFLQRNGWVRDERLPSVEWLEGLWLGWEGELGVVPRSGAALRHGAERWTPEALPVQEVSAVGCGMFPMVAGQVGKNTIISSLDERGWDIEVAWEGLKVHALWVAGSPKPPRLLWNKEQGPGEREAEPAS